MQNLTLFLIKLQTFELHIIIKGELQNRLKKTKRNLLIALLMKRIFTIHLVIGVKSGY